MSTLTKERLDELKAALTAVRECDILHGREFEKREANLDKLLWAYYHELIAAAEIGVKWETNSSLEEWFPITAEEMANVKKDYHELLFAVGRKYPNETRHQTALRYIQQREDALPPPSEESKAPTQ